MREVAPVILEVAPIKWEVAPIEWEVALSMWPDIFLIGSYGPSMILRK